MSYRPSVIRSIQRGTITCTNGASGTTATITAVTTANTIIRWLGARAGTSGSNDSRLWNGRIELTNSTTVTAYSQSTTTVVSYEVVEYYARVIKSVQRGTFSMGVGHPVNTTISSVVTAKTQVDILGLVTSISDASSSVYPTVELTSSTNLRATTAGTTTTTTVGYQVVEFR